MSRRAAKKRPGRMTRAERRKHLITITNAQFEKIDRWVDELGYRERFGHPLFVDGTLEVPTERDFICLLGTCRRLINEKLKRKAVQW